MNIIALSGKLGSGKDFIYNQYLKPMGYHRWALADHFKIWIVGCGRATYEEVFQTKPPHVRHLLQQEGTENGRNIFGKDIWLDVAFAWMTHLGQTWNIENFCITDVRFPNEVEYVQRHHGKVFRIIAPMREHLSGATKEARNHISETALDDYPLNTYDALLYNDPTQEATVGYQIKNLLGNI